MTINIHSLVEKCNKTMTGIKTNQPKITMQYFVMYNLEDICTVNGNDSQT